MQLGRLLAFQYSSLAIGTLPFECFRFFRLQYIALLERDNADWENHPALKDYTE